MLSLNREAPFRWKRGRPRPQLSAKRERFLKGFRAPRGAGEGARAPSDARFETPNYMVLMTR
jgi:hypothetical protein